MASIQFILQNTLMSHIWSSNWAKIAGRVSVNFKEVWSAIFQWAWFYTIYLLHVECIFLSFRGGCTFTCSTSTLRWDINILYLTLNACIIYKWWQFNKFNKQSGSRCQNQQIFWKHIHNYTTLSTESKILALKFLTGVNLGSTCPKLVLKWV